LTLQLRLWVSAAVEVVGTTFLQVRAPIALTPVLLALVRRLGWARLTLTRQLTSAFFELAKDPCLVSRNGLINFPEQSQRMRVVVLYMLAVFAEPNRKLRAADGERQKPAVIQLAMFESPFPQPADVERNVRPDLVELERFLTSAGYDAKHPRTENHDGDRRWRFAADSLTPFAGHRSERTDVLMQLLQSMGRQ
jgi:hypothetical protein